MGSGEDIVIIHLNQLIARIHDCEIILSEISLEYYIVPYNQSLFALINTTC